MVISSRQRLPEQAVGDVEEARGADLAACARGDQLARALGRQRGLPSGPRSSCSTATCIRIRSPGRQLLRGRSGVRVISEGVTATPESSRLFEARRASAPRRMRSLAYSIACFRFSRAWNPPRRCRWATRAAAWTPPRHVVASSKRSEPRVRRPLLELARRWHLAGRGVGRHASNSRVWDAGANRAGLRSSAGRPSMSGPCALTGRVKVCWSHGPREGAA